MKGRLERLRLRVDILVNALETCMAASIVDERWRKVL